MCSKATKMAKTIKHSRWDNDEYNNTCLECDVRDVRDTHTRTHGAGTVGAISKTEQKWHMPMCSSSSDNSKIDAWWWWWWWWWIIHDLVTVVATTMCWMHGGDLDTQSGRHSPSELPALFFLLNLSHPWPSRCGHSPCSCFHLSCYFSPVPLFPPGLFFRPLYQPASASDCGCFARPETAVPIAAAYWLDSRHKRTRWLIDINISLTSPVFVSGHPGKQEQPWRLTWLLMGG